MLNSSLKKGFTSLNLTRNYASHLQKSKTKLLTSLFSLPCCFQKDKTELAGKAPHILTFHQNSKMIKYYVKTKFPSGNLNYFKDNESKSKLSWKQFSISWSITVLLAVSKRSIFSCSPCSLDKTPLCSSTSG